MAQIPPGGRNPNAPALPAAVGPLSEHVCTLLGRSRRRPLPALPALPVDPLDRDAQLAWFSLNALHYGGWSDVSDDLEWAPSVVATRAALEHWFLEAVRPLLPDGPRDPSVAIHHALGGAATATAGAPQPGISRYLAERGTAAQVAESLVLRFPYQRNEADPHTFVVPRLDGEVKRAICALQAGEYGVGHRSSHAELYLAALAASGAPTRPDAVWPLLPGPAFATFNLISLGGLNRRWRGVAVGQLCLFEMDSVAPNGAMVRACDRLGLPAAVRRFHQVHVLADAEHEQLVDQVVLRRYPELEPDQVDNMLLGIRAQAWIDGRVAAHAVGRWSSGRSALEPAAAPQDAAA